MPTPIFNNLINIADPTTLTMANVASGIGGNYLLVDETMGRGCKTFTMTAQGSSVTSISTTPGFVYGGAILNIASTVVYVLVYDATGSVTVGSTSPKIIIGVPVNASTAADGIGSNWMAPDCGIIMNNGIQIAVVTTLPGSGGPSTGLIGTLFYN